MTIAVDLGHKATKQTNKHPILCTNFTFQLKVAQLNTTKRKMEGLKKTAMITSCQ